MFFIWSLAFPFGKLFLLCLHLRPSMLAGKLLWQNVASLWFGFLDCLADRVWSKVPPHHFCIITSAQELIRSYLFLRSQSLTLQRRIHLHLCFEMDRYWKFITSMEQVTVTCWSWRGLLPQLIMKSYWKLNLCIMTGLEHDLCIWYLYNIKKYCGINDSCKESKIELQGLMKRNDRFDDSMTPFFANSESWLVHYQQPCTKRQPS